MLCMGWVHAAGIVLSRGRVVVGSKKVNDEGASVLKNLLVSRDYCSPPQAVEGLIELH